MRLNKREKILVMLLLFVLAGYLTFQYVITPQRAALSELKQSAAGWEVQKQRLTTIDRTIEQLTTDKSTAEQEIQTIGNGYFNSLTQQEDAIILLNELLLNTGDNDLAISFEKRADELTGTAAGAPIVQNISMSVEGTYDQVWNLLRKVWNFEKCITITDFSMRRTETGQIGGTSDLLTGEIGLSLYDLSGMTHINENLVQWSDSGTFRKQNPFATITGEVFPGTRYVLIRNDTSTTKYVKFTDIAGHWAEAAIDSFGSRHLITGDEMNRYFPDDAMTRGELVVLLDNVFHWETPAQPVDLTGFSDYSELGQSLDAMEKAFYKGFLNNYFVGYGDGSLRPNAPTSYLEFELVMSRVLEQADYTWLKSATQILQETGYTSPGIENKDAYITKAEVVYFLNSLPQ